MNNCNCQLGERAKGPIADCPLHGTEAQEKYLINQDKRERAQAVALLKAALEFNANIVMIATQVMITGKNTNIKAVQANMKENIASYKETIENIFK